MSATGHIPTRRCVGCGKVAAKKTLLRVVVRDGAALADPRQRLPGRGAYLCGPACLPRTLKKRALDRSFRRTVAVQAQAIEQAFAPLTGGAGKN